MKLRAGILSKVKSTNKVHEFNWFSKLVNNLHLKINPNFERWMSENVEFSTDNGRTWKSLEEL